MFLKIRLMDCGGGGGGGGYVSPNIDDFERATASTVFNRLGANPAYQQYNYNPNINYSAQPAQRGVGASVGLPAPRSKNGVVALNSTVKPGLTPRQSQQQSDAVNPMGASKNQPNKADYSKYDFSNTGTPLIGPNAVGYASQGYDFSPVNEAIEGYRKPGKLTQTYTGGTYNPNQLSQTYTGATYNPYQFNFGSLPDEYTKMAYQSGASDINRAGQDRLTQLRESTGTRKPGLLLKAGENAARDTNKNLLGLNTQLQLNRINQNLGLAKDQQLAQAGENFGAAGFNAGEGYKGYQSRADLERANEDRRAQAAQFNAGERYKGYQSRADLEKANEDNRFRNLGALASTGQQRIASQAGLTQAEREYQDKAIQYLMNLYQAATGQANTAAQLANQEDAQTMQTLMGLGQLGVSVAALCLPLGTQIETKDSFTPVENLKVGDQVKGGKVIAISSRLRSQTHKFSKHIFNTGEVIMTKGHPYFDELVSVEPIEHNSICTCDILTDSGFYYVNGVKLGSTLSV